MDLGEFAQRIARVAVELEKGTERAVRKAALAVDQTVVLATPVDTGRARANWTVSLNAPATEQKPAPASPEAGAAEAIAQGKEEAEKFRVSHGNTIYISNNLPYIGRLNEGHSAQAPANFVERAVLTGLEAVQKTKVLGGDKGV